MSLALVNNAAQLALSLAATREFFKIDDLAGKLMVPLQVCC